MATDILFSVRRAAGVPVQASGKVVVEVHYVRSGKDEDGTDASVSQCIRLELDEQLKGAIRLEAAASHRVDASVLAGDGSSLLTRAITADDTGAAVMVLRGEDVQLIIKGHQALPADSVPASVTRVGRFIPTGSVGIDYTKSGVVLVPVTDAGMLAASGIESILHSDGNRITAMEVTGQNLAGLNGLSWIPTHMAVDGSFTISLSKQKTIGWLWWLSGGRQILGFMPDDLSAADRKVVVIALPVLAPLKAGAEGSSSKDCVDCGRTVPADVTEAEVADNPGVYTEDPGSYCRPFSNPERVLSERSFSVIARITQPEIGPLGSVKTKTMKLMNLEGEIGSSLATTGVAERRVMLEAALPSRHILPGRYEDLLNRLPSGRTTMDANHPMQWEDDIAQYQAATVAIGHILEFRVRWRSNGYSLGTVAKTLTLAPRQTKRIQKIEWERSEKARRTERTQLRDQVSDDLVRERDYHDGVAASLSEWATGSSSSDTEAIAGGIGFFAGSILGGIGGGAASSHSSSQQEGGRNTTASEEQRLRDSIRRHGDALRKLESTVVNEVTQEETVTGTTEVIRNPNYGHALTVIYYQILRHLKVITSFAGVRECIFVPFAIKPFDIQRAYRWREALQASIRSSRYARALQYLKDVVTNFSTSDIVPGPRAGQQLTYLRGSIYVSLGIERPRDTDDGKFDAARWLVTQSLLGAPAFGIFSILAEVNESQRDRIFQAEHAPGMAARWANEIQIKVGGSVRHADCTLASRYQFNRTVRIDFVMSGGELAGLTRQSLQQLVVAPIHGLPPGSVANLTRMTLTYNTDRFERTVEGRTGTNDLINAMNGNADNASVLFPLDAWEQVDERLEIRRSVDQLIEHLNEHVEYYHKAVWWRMDRDRLMMLLDGFYVPGTNNVSIASVVDREPIGIIGNSVIYRVGAASFLGYGEVKTPADLYNVYANKGPVSDPLLVSLPTDGLYAQTVMDECAALEEHYGNTDWVLSDPDPDLGTIDPALMQTRQRDQTAATQPTAFPGTIINLQNAPEAPAPSGLQGALNAVTNPGAFRDMAGLAQTQANAMGALNTAAGLATNFGNQAAAIELAKSAAKGQAAKAADQQVASVQGALNKKLITPEVAAQHTDKILGEMHSPTTITPPHQDGGIGDAIRKAAGLPGSTIKATTSEGQVEVSLASFAGPGSVSVPARASSPAPATVVNNFAPVEGIDVYSNNSDAEIPPFNVLWNAGYRFVIHKSNEFVVDSAFVRRWPLLSAAGFIRGSYDLVNHAAGSATAQAKQAAGVVQRLAPGDLGPSLDMEDRDNAHSHANDPGFWVDFAHEYLDAIETALGRRPMIYTSRSYWHEFTDDSNEFIDYPLWVIRINNPTADPPPVWPTWTIWQWHTEISTTPMPPPFTAAQRGVDLNHFNGTIHGLRGLADLGHTAPHLVGNLPFVTYGEPDGRIHLLEFVSGSWHDQDVLGAPFGHVIGTLPLAAGDPAAIALGDEQVIIYRSADGGIQALTRNLTDTDPRWNAVDITGGGGRAIGDPCVIVSGNDIHVVYWDQFNAQVHVMRVNGVWQAESFTENGGIAGPSRISGSAAAYIHEDILHIVSRSGADGHLFDFSTPVYSAQPLDLTAAGHDSNGVTPPAATYRPVTYKASGQATRIVFRAVRGIIWQIERDTLSATNLSAAAGAPPAAGSPTAVAADVVHILYRGTDSTVNEIFDDNGTWKTRPVCAGAASDPSAYVDELGHAAASFRTLSGGIRIARFISGSWKCEDATQIQNPALPAMDPGEPTIPV
jgi:GH25 family lysozyme M1 (1,4-beta-N-acetylmuramidase)